jgi:hypothetical protein
VWRVGRQVEQFELAIERVDVIFNELGLMDWMTIEDHENGPTGADHQTRQKFFEDRRGHRTFVDHEAEFAARTYRGNHVERKASSGYGNHRRFAYGRPGRTGVIVGANPGFVGEINGCAFGASLGFDRRIGSRLPFVDQLGILLPSLIERLLHGEAQELHDATDRRQHQGFAEFPLDQFADQRQGPQAEFEFGLLRRMVSHRLGDPTHFVGADLRWVTGNGLGQQGLLPAVGELRQPAKMVSRAQAICDRDRRAALSAVGA